MTKTSKDEPQNPAVDWHQFQPPLEAPPKGEGEATGETADGGDCETCGQPEDALVHDVDDAGNPTAEAQAKASGVV